MSALPNQGLQCDYYDLRRCPELIREKSTKGTKEKEKKLSMKNFVSKDPPTINSENGGFLKCFRRFFSKIGQNIYVGISS